MIAGRTDGCGFTVENRGRKCWTESIATTVGHRMNRQDDVRDVRCGMRLWRRSFRLCSGIFFIDGIKRDKWIWGGDAYQSLFVNQYLMADADIDRRTLLALRGNDPMTTHINTILDYSL